jgi:Holliday junction resolvasome RuvABC endonuclease subunit
MSKTHTKIDLSDKSAVNSLIAQIERILEQSCRSYEFANDGAISEEDRAFYDKRYQRLTDEVEKILAHYDIKCMRPGLYPVYVKQDGKQEHNLRWALVGSLVE